MRKILLTMFGLLLAYSTLAQYPSENRVQRGPTQLAMACGGVWNDVQTAIRNLKRLDLSAKAEQERVTCLLGAIADTTFDARDVNYDRLLANSEIELLVHAYGLEGYDFFAGEMKARTGRVHDALLGVLLKAGHPEAFASYFAEKRQITPTLPRKPVIPGASLFFAPFIEQGKCLDAACSPRLPEALGVIHANLDLVAKILDESANAKPSTSVPSIIQHEDELRQEDVRLLAEVRQIQRGEATIGHLK